MAYRVTKTYGHDLGLSACFRQHRATSHCRFLHGYALSFKFTFEADELDARNWVMDFGGLRELKEWLCQTFDHKLLIAADDPYREELDQLALYRLADPLLVHAVGCEAFARMAWDAASQLLMKWRTREVAPLRQGVQLIEVECREHGANGASYMGERS
jgi:6-pyruvoyltetrahydropterin/6-carboxytetrahydropterin synthase